MIPVGLLAAGLTIGELVIVLGALGGAGGVATLLLLPRQGRSIAVQASESAVRAVNAVLERQEEELKESRAELARAHRALDEDRRRHHAEIEAMRNELADANTARRLLVARVETLQVKVDRLEAKLARTRSAIDAGRIGPEFELDDDELDGPADSNDRAGP